jgi:hypothetical protein
MEAADRAVLSTVERQLLCLDIVEAAIDRALDRLLAVRSQRDDERARLMARQESLEAEIKTDGRVGWRRGPDIHSRSSWDA